MFNELFFCSIYFIFVFIFRVFDIVFCCLCGNILIVFFVKLIFMMCGNFWENIYFMI